MRKNLIYKLISLFAIFQISTGMISESTRKFNQNETPELNLVYDNIWGSIYHAVERQCDKTPTITGDGSKINVSSASDLRWIAISQEMLDDEYRLKLRLKKDSTCELFKGRIQYGDTIWIESPYPEINGWWVVHDAKNERYRNSIDFLQTVGDKSLFNDNPKWSGKFENIQIYKKNPLFMGNNT